MTVTRETLSLYLDGELDQNETARVAEIVAHDPELKLFVKNQERLRERLQTDLGAILNGPIPDRLLRAARETREPAWQRLKDAARFSWSPRSLLGGAAAAACALVLGIAIGAETLRPVTAGSDFTSGPQGLVASGQLASALETRLASDTTGPARIGLTFKDKSGALCRSFALSQPSSSNDGYACKEGGSWQVGALINGSRTQTESGYALAGSSLPDPVRDAIMARMSGNPLDATEERRARDRGWN